ncbi:MAG: NirD/YgiW/YdeI family stress tolerance protein [Gammaproteobacteria bacterium]|nr:stress-induced protein YgiW [Gammaproteobacteria bacterium]
MRHTFLILTMLLAVAAHGQEQPQEPGTRDRGTGQEGQWSRFQTAARVVTVQEVLAAPRDDEDVILRGRIVRHLRGDHYLFTDGTGEIEVEIDDDDAPRGGVKLNVDVELHGEVDLDRNRRPKIDVDEVVY